MKTLLIIILLSLPLWGHGLIQKDFEIPERYQYREWSEEERLMMAFFFDDGWFHAGLDAPELQQFFDDHFHLGRDIAKAVYYVEDLQTWESVVLSGRMRNYLTYYYPAREIVDMVIDNLDKILSVVHEEYLYHVRVGAMQAIASHGTSKDFWVIDRLNDESTRSDAEYLKASILRREAEGKVPTSLWESKQQEAAEAAKNPVLKVITPRLQAGKPNLACYLWTTLVLVTCTGLFLWKRRRAHS